MKTQTNEEIIDARKKEVERKIVIHDAITMEFVELTRIGERLVVALGNEPTAIDTPSGRFIFQPKL